MSKLPAGTTKGDLCQMVAPQVTFDVALPQGWVNHVTSQGFDPRGQVVWAYPQGYVCGMPMPLTTEARAELYRLKELTWEE